MTEATITPTMTDEQVALMHLYAKWFRRDPMTDEEKAAVRVAALPREDGVSPLAEAANAFTAAVRETHPDYPTIGTPVTMCYPQDCYPYVVVNLNKRRPIFEIARINTSPREVGFGPADYVNGFPRFDHKYTAEEIRAHVDLDNVRKVYWRGGRWVTDARTPVRLGEARYRRDFSD